MVNTGHLVYIWRITMINDYSDLPFSYYFFYTLKDLFIKFMDFVKTPWGWAFIAVAIILFFVFKRSKSSS